jgi:hypothetical protein
VWPAAAQPPAVRSAAGPADLGFPKAAAAHTAAPARCQHAFGDWTTSAVWLSAAARCTPAVAPDRLAAATAGHAVFDLLVREQPITRCAARRRQLLSPHMRGTLFNSSMDSSPTAMPHGAARHRAIAQRTHCVPAADALHAGRQRPAACTCSCTHPHQRMPVQHPHTSAATHRHAVPGPCAAKNAAAQHAQLTAADTTRQIDTAHHTAQHTGEHTAPCTRDDCAHDNLLAAAATAPRVTQDALSHV